MLRRAKTQFNKKILTKMLQTHFFEELCANIVCGKGAIKTVAVSDMTSCHCACPKFHQGDANIECKGIKGSAINDIKALERKKLRPCVL